WIEYCPPKAGVVRSNRAGRATIPSPVPKPRLRNAWRGFSGSVPRMGVHPWAASPAARLYPDWGDLLLRSACAGSTHPESRREQHQQAEHLEPAEQHGERADPGLEIG